LTAGPVGYCRHMAERPASSRRTPIDSGITPHVLREYSLLADGRRGALVGPRGDICWLCLPTWDSDAVFAALIGGAGRFAVHPIDPFVWGGYYESRTLIWRSRWVTQRGVVVCREALSYPAEAHRAVVLRRIEPAPAALTVRIALDVAAGFGAHRLHGFHRDREDVWSARSGPVYVRLSSGRASALAPGRATDGAPTLMGDVSLASGEICDLVLEVSDQPLTGAPPDPATAWSMTENAWHDAVPATTGTLADRDATASRAVLRGLTDPGGGMVAAATMSLPERAEQGRNYDYRYVWIRDQSMAGQAAAAVGASDLMDAAVSFVGERLLSDGPRLQPAYTTGGSTVPDEHVIDIPGYPGGFDVAGNHVNRQFQLDTFGEALLLFAAAAHAERLTVDGWRAAEIAVGAIGEQWRDPEAGIWELQDDIWTESRLICVAGLRALSDAGAPRRRMAAWEALADTVLADTAQRCLHPSGWWQRSPGDGRSDASLLLPVIRGGWTAKHPRTVATVGAIEHDLTDDLFVYRFRHHPGPLSDAEGAFLLCGFSMALAQQQLGDPIKAVRYFERNRSACGPPGLFSEEYDVDERQMRGNLPQAFVHAMFLETAARLAGP